MKRRSGPYTHRTSFLQYFHMSYTHPDPTVLPGMRGILLQNSHLRPRVALYWILVEAFFLLPFFVQDKELEDASNYSQSVDSF